jgi:anti-sigma B factor antagonist
MHIAPCDVTVRQLNSQVAEIVIKGELSGFSHQTLLDAFCQANEPGTQAIIFDFTQVAYLNSSGIGLLVTLLIQARRAGHRLIGYGLNQHYLKIFELTRLSESMPVFGSRGEALAAIGG